MQIKNETLDEFINKERKSDRGRDRVMGDNEMEC